MNTAYPSMFPSTFYSQYIALTNLREHLTKPMKQFILTNACTHFCGSYVIIKESVSVFMSVNECVHQYEYVSVYIDNETVDQQTTLIVRVLPAFLV